MRFYQILFVAAVALDSKTSAQDLLSNTLSHDPSSIRHLQEEPMPDNSAIFSGSVANPSSGVVAGKAGKTSKTGKATCTRRTEPKKTKVCKEKNPYNGLQDIVIAAPDQTADPAAIQRCVAAFRSSGYSEYDFANYHKWFNDDSTMMLADTGFWKGVEGITEYVQAALVPLPCESKPLMSNVVGVNGTENLLPIKAEGDKCTMVLTSVVTFQNKCLFPGDINSIYGSRYSFTIVDDVSSPQATILVNRIDTYLPPGVLQFLVTATKIDSYAEKVCATMMSGCPETFEKNCYNAPGEVTGLDKCMAELLSLPATDNDGPTFNGKSFGCRFLHSIFAGSNAKHCGHISFDPEYDPNCYTKCQDAAGITNADMFHPIELGFLAGEAAKHGLPVEQWKYTKE